MHNFKHIRPSNAQPQASVQDTRLRTAPQQARVIALIIIFVSSTFCSSIALANQGVKEAKIIFEQVIKELDQIQSVAMPRDRQAAQIAAIVEKYFNFTYATRVSIGRRWNEFTADEKVRYFKTYRVASLRKYARLFMTAKVSEVQITPKDSGTQGRDVVLAYKFSPLEHASDTVKEIGEVDAVFRLRKYDGQLKIIDLTVSGVSIVAEDRESYINTLESDGFEALLKKIENVKA